MTLFRLLALCWAVAGMTMKTAQPAPQANAPGGENAMANTYGFLRTASNNVGNTVEGVLDVEGSLTDMKKDLDMEYQRWKGKKKVLLSEREKLSSEVSRLKGVLLQQEETRQEVQRIKGNVAAQQAENVKAAAANKEAEARRALDRKGMNEDIDALKCATKAIQQAKQVKIDEANKKTKALKEQNRILQQQVFKANQDFNTLVTTSLKLNVTNKATTSGFLGQVEALQNQIHGLEKDLVAQAQLEEMVERARERLSTQSSETVRQREKLTAAQSKCMDNRHRVIDEIEAAKRSLNNANTEMMQCQNLDGENQRMQAELNECINRKRSER